MLPATRVYVQSCVLWVGKLLCSLMCSTLNDSRLALQAGVYCTQWNKIHAVPLMQSDFRYLYVRDKGWRRCPRGASVELTFNLRGEKYCWAPVGRWVPLASSYREAPSMKMLALSRALKSSFRISCGMYLQAQTFLPYGPLGYWDQGNAWALQTPRS